jgi:hypothetical protein
MSAAVIRLKVFFRPFNFFDPQPVKADDFAWHVADRTSGSHESLFFLHGRTVSGLLSCVAGQPAVIVI